MNKWIGIGNLTKDPELSYTQNNNARCMFTLAINRPKRNGEDAGADYIRIVTWNREAEICNQYLSKGSKCAVEGSVRTGSYKDKDGKTVYTTDIWANNVEFLGNAQNHERVEKTPQNANNGYERSRLPQSNPISWDDLPDSFSAAEDDIPF